MTEVTVSQAEPLWRRIGAWMDERFPPANALLFFILYLACAVVARQGNDAENSGLQWLDVVACLVTWSLFLLIRIFDEHKDYAIDVINHPQRVLQSGRITLSHLKILGAIAIVVQMVFSWFVAAETGAMVWALMFIYLCLMGVEFFCGAWLEKQLLLYALTHMAIMPLIVWWLAVLANPEVQFTPVLIAMMSLAFVSGFCFEITRKTRGPEEERDTVDSYTKILGLTGATWLVAALVSAMVINQIVLLWLADVAWLAIYALLAVLVWVLAIKSLKAFLAAPSLEGREANEKAVALTMLLGYVLVISALLIGGGA